MAGTYFLLPRVLGHEIHFAVNRVEAAFKQRTQARRAPAKRIRPRVAELGIFKNPYRHG